MKTDNNIVSNESLEDAKKRLNKFSINDKALSQPIYNNGFEMGAAWKEEQLKPLLESHAELLDTLTIIDNRLKETFGAIEYELGKYSSLHTGIKSAIEKANKLLNSIK